VIVRGVAVEAQDGVRVRIEARSDRGEPLGARELAAAPGQCAGLRDAIDLVLTLFVEYESPSASARRVVPGVGAELGLAQAPLPRLALSAGPAFYLALGDVIRLHASAAYWPPVSIETARGVGASLEAVSLRLRGCALAFAGLGLCTGLEGGALIATPLELAGPEHQVRLLLQGLLEAAFELELGSAARLQLAAGGLLSLSRPELSYIRADGERSALYRPELVGLSFRVILIIPTE
jgi:hypothetical protein